jgi:hypothetical protein
MSISQISVGTVHDPKDKRINRADPRLYGCTEFFGWRACLHFKLKWSDASILKCRSFANQKNR